MSDTDELPRASGPALLAASIRNELDDFRVDELPSFAPSGDGEHLLLEVEKRGLTTVEAARRLAAWAGVALDAIGYAGLKDRHAVTRQRFSVHLPKRIAPDIAACDHAELNVLSATWHRRKLPRGALSGNRFGLRLRAVRLADGVGRDDVERRLQALATRGVPNYFGEQRFGRRGDNVEQAMRMFAGMRVRREQRSLLLSAARSAIFNAVLAARVDAGDWSGGRDGEVWMLDGSRSIFGPQAYDAELAARIDAQDIHPTGPLWGRGELRTAGAVRALEQQVATAHAELCRGLEQAGMQQERRALRMRVDGPEWRWTDGGDLELGFSLPAGAYATVVLRELGIIVDAARAARA